jgi:tRNA(Ile)-lysidine synthase
MKGKKKVSDFLIDNKIPLHQKEKQLVMLSGEDIVWLVGQRIDNRYKTTPATKDIYQIRWNENLSG